MEEEVVVRVVAAKEMEEPELFEELDMKEYFFELPEAVDTFEELRATNPSDKRTLPMALLNRAKADIPLIEQLEKDHPRMARLFNRGLLPNSVWEQLLDAEACMDTEVHDVQAEAEKLQKLRPGGGEDRGGGGKRSSSSASSSVSFISLLAAASEGASSSSIKPTIKSESLFSPFLVNL